MNKPIKVLIIEADADSAKMLQEYCLKSSFDLIGTVVSTRKALTIIEEEKPNLLVADVQHLVNGMGVEFLEQLSKNDTISLVLLYEQDDATIMKAMEMIQPISIILKPIHPLQLQVSMKIAHEKIKAEIELKDYNKYLENVITERTQDFLAELKMHKDAHEHSVENEIKLKAITTAANDAIMLFDEYGIITFWNKAAENMFKFKEKEMINQNIRVLFSSDYQNDGFARGLEVIQMAIDNELKEEKNIEIMATCADGIEIPVEMSLACVDIEGSHNVVSIVRNMSQRKQHLEEISLFKQIAELANYGLAVTDAAGRFIYINKYLAELVEHKPEKIIGKSFFTITPHIKKSDIVGFVAEASTLQGGEGKEATIVSTSNEEIPVMLNSVIIRDKYGKPKYYAVSAIDVRERKEYEDNLLKSKKLAEESDRMKTAFLSTISHELRTPLNAIIGFSELIRIGDLEADEMTDFNDEIYKSGNHLLSIVEDILDISLLESKNQKLISTDFSLNSLMRKLHSKFHSNERYTTKDIELKWTGNLDDDKDNFFADNSRLEQVFSKLIDNAFKFSMEGTIEFGYHYLKKNDKIEFFVKDEGMGISKEKLHIIFDSFKQAEYGDDHVHDGLGLGLSIVTQILELMKGKIEVDSKIGEGSTFRFYI